jgi:hypothetical protein
VLVIFLTLFLGVAVFSHSFFGTQQYAVAKPLTLFYSVRNSKYNFHILLTPAFSVAVTLLHVYLANAPFSPRINDIFTDQTNISELINIYFVYDSIIS